MRTSRRVMSLAGVCSLLGAALIIDAGPAQAKELTLCWAAYNDSASNSKSKLCDLIIGDSQRTGGEVAVGVALNNATAEVTADGLIVGDVQHLGVEVAAGGVVLGIGTAEVTAYAPRETFAIPVDVIGSVHSGETVYLHVTDLETSNGTQAAAADTTVPLTCQDSGGGESCVMS